MPDMKILKFQAENVAGIINVEIDCGGDDVSLAGKNGAGKSSICESIITTLRGGKLPLRDETQPGRVFLDMGAYTIRRTITDKERLEIRTKEGFKQDREPRAFLSRLAGPVGADPGALILAKEKDQVDILLSLAPGLSEQLKAVADMQAEVDRSRSNNWAIQNAARVKLKEMPPADPVTRLDTAALFADLQDVQNQNRQILVSNTSIEDAATDAEELRKTISFFVDQIRNLQDRQSAAQAVLEMKLKLAGTPKAELVDEQSIRTRIAEADSINARANQNDARALAEADLARAVEANGPIDDLAEKVARQRADILRTSMPVPGLDINDGTVVFNGVPLSRLSSGEKARLGVAIATASNPAAKVLICDNASLLDPETRAAIKEAAGDRYQIWWILNECTPTGTTWFIQEGKVAAKPSPSSSTSSSSSSEKQPFTEGH